MLRLYAGNGYGPSMQACLPRYDLEVRRAPFGWRVGIYSRTADLPILRRCKVFASDQDEARGGG